jgi:hypothetical protein
MQRSLRLDGRDQDFILGYWMKRQFALVIAYAQAVGVLKKFAFLVVVIATIRIPSPDLLPGSFAPRFDVLGSFFHPLPCFGSGYSGF